jgi:hypothetical protein
MMDICQKFPGAEFWTNIFTHIRVHPFFSRRQSLALKFPSLLKDGWIIFPVIRSYPGFREKIINEFKPCEITCVSLLIVLPSRLQATAALRKRFNILQLTLPGYA